MLENLPTPKKSLKELEKDIEKNNICSNQINL